MKEIVDRLHRVQGQLTSIETAINDEIPCEVVVPQLLAVKGAMNGIVNAYLEASIDSCVSTNDPEKMKQLITTLLKHS